jgi:hypothetical protein
VPQVSQDQRGLLQAAEKGEILDETSKKHTAGAEAHADSIGVMPGINPRPTRPHEFFRSL